MNSTEKHDENSVMDKTKTLTKYKKHSENASTIHFCDFVHGQTCDLVTIPLESCYAH